MDRQTFERLSLNDQVKFINTRPSATMKQIAAEIGMPASSLSHLFSQSGYVRVKGVYVKKEALTPQSDSLQELLQYKDQILSMVLKECHEQPTEKLDFSFLNNYDQTKKKIVSFALPEDFVTEIDVFIKNTGYIKQSVFALSIYQLMKHFG
jgi:hypothetical protein